MQDERPAPRVSISDPNTPSGYGDVLRSGDDRPPWRPNRHQLRVLLTVLLVLLVTVPPTLWFKHRSDERAADRQSLAGVRFSLVEQNDPPLLHFRNDGPAGVTVLSVRLERFGSRTVQVDQQLPSQGILDLSIPVPTCPSVVPPTGPSGVVLAVRTSRGGAREVRIDLQDTTNSLAFLEDLRQTCQLFEPEESIELGSSTLSLDGRALVVTLALHNRSTLKRGVTLVGAGPGLHITATPPLPLAVPPAVRGEQAQGAAAILAVRLTVADCARAVQIRHRPDEPPGMWPYDKLSFAVDAREHLSEFFLGDSYEQLLRKLVDVSC